MKGLAVALLLAAAPAPEVTLTPPAKPRHVVFSDDRRTAVVRCADRTLRLFGLPDGQPGAVAGPAAEGTWLMRLSGGGKRLATAGNGPQAQLWDATTGASLGTFPIDGHAYALAISDDGARVAAGDARPQVVVWDGAAETRLPLGGEAQDLAFSPDGSLLAAAGADALVRVFHLPDGQVVATLDDSPFSQFALAFSPDGSRLAAAGADGSVRVYDAASWKTLHRTAAGKLPGAVVAFRPGGELFAAFVAVARGAKPAWLLWNPASGAERRGEVDGPLLGGSADGELIAVADGDRVRVRPLLPR